MRLSAHAMITAFALVACRSSPSRAPSCDGDCGHPPTARPQSAVPLDAAAPADPARHAGLAPSGEPECDRYIAALEAAKECHPQPPGTPEKMQASIDTIVSALRDVPREKETARAMLVAGCKHGADEVRAALTSMGCRTP